MAQQGGPQRFVGENQKEAAFAEASDIFCQRSGIECKIASGKDFFCPSFSDEKSHISLEKGIIMKMIRQAKADKTIEE